jgi:hypothetical protein
LLSGNSRRVWFISYVLVIPVQALSLVADRAAAPVPPTTLSDL